MKLDSTFFDKLTTELTQSEREFKKKYIKLAVFSALIWWAVLSLLWQFQTVKNWADGSFAQYAVIYALPIILFFVAKVMFDAQTEERVLTKIALENGGTYSTSLDIRKEKGAMFREGHSPKLEGELAFISKNKEKFRLFRYVFYKGHGKYKREYSYRVFGVGGFQVIPHMYLNYKKNNYSLSLGQKLSLPSAFENEFILSIPPSYHIEALQIFTPDVLEAILRLPFKCDIEFVNGEIIFYLENRRRPSFKSGLLNDLPKMKQIVEGARDIVSLISHKIQNIKWAPVGDKKWSL